VGILIHQFCDNSSAGFGGELDEGCLGTFLRESSKDVSSDAGGAL